MSWSNFTQTNIKLFTKYKYEIDNNNFLLNYIKNERKKLLKNKIKINFKISKLIKNDDIYNYFKGKFVDYKNLLKDMETLHDIYEIKWNNNFIIIKTNEAINHKYIKIIISIIEYLKEKAHNNKDVKIFLVLSRLKKEFPKETKEMGIRNANSGYNDSMNDVIFIWRREEFEKVLFHELIHNFNLDKRHDHQPNIIHTNGPHLYFEAITDFQGIIYHLIFLSITSRIKIKILLEYELGFIQNQAMNLNEIWELGNWKEKPTNLIEQKTAAFSYYILKYLIFEYYLYHIVDLSEEYEIILKKVLKNGFIMKPFIKINSSRMTLLQLK